MKKSPIFINEFSDIVSLEKELTQEGYFIDPSKSKKDQFCFKKGDSEEFISVLIKKNAVFGEAENTITKKPDYSNSLISLSTTLKNYYLHQKDENQIPELTEILHKGNYQNIVLFLLDGFGYNILKLYEKDIPFLKQHFFKKISSTFPPTTVCATNALLNGKAPIETGIIGWQQFFKKYNRNIQIFTNIDFYNKEKVDCDILGDILKEDRFFKNFPCRTHELFPDFMPEGFLSFSEMCEAVNNICHNEEKNFVYCYWDKPDSFMHQNGILHSSVQECLIELNQQLERLISKLSDKTLVLLTSDHGHINIKGINLTKFSILWDMLEVLPSFEPRCASFHVKKEYLRSFKETFYKYFSSVYDLYTREEFLAAGFLGNPSSKKHPSIDDFIGDYIGIAKTEYTLFFTTEDHYLFKGHHAGTTVDELEIGLYILKE